MASLRCWVWPGKFLAFNFLEKLFSFFFFSGLWCITQHTLHLFLLVRQVSCSLERTNDAKGELELLTFLTLLPQCWY